MACRWRSSWQSGRWCCSARRSYAAGSRGGWMSSSGGRVTPPLANRRCARRSLWSWELLEPWEQSALAQCAVFRGGFSVRAAEEVVDMSKHAGAPPTARILRSLRAHSLIQVAPHEGVEHRCRLLESVREFALAELQRSGGEEATRRRHAEHFVRMAREVSATRAAEVLGPIWKTSWPCATWIRLRPTAHSKRSRCSSA